MALSLHAVIDDEVMLGAFYDFVSRYHAEETLMFWLSAEVFRNRNWKAAKFFGMDADPLPVAKAPTMAPPASTPSKKAEIERRKSRKDKKTETAVNMALSRQRQLDQSAAQRLGVSLEQLYLVKEADFIFDNFIKRDGVYWTCLDADTAREIEEQLTEPATLKRNLFEKAQTQAFNGMNDDLMPRFLKEIIQASIQDPIPPHMKVVCDRFDELRKSPIRRKTGVSTALAFMFRRTSSEKDSKLQTVSSREMGKFDGRKSVANPTATNGTEATAVDANKASSLLRQKSHLKLLGPDGGAVSALALSRSRLSYGSESPLLGADSKKSSLGSKRSNLGLKKPARSLHKRISAPVTHDGEGDRNSLSRRMEIGIQRSQSDSKLLTRGSHVRAKEMGLEPGATVGGRSTISKGGITPTGESVTVFIDQSSTRKNSI